MFYYTVIDSVIVGKSNNPILNSLDEVIPSVLDKGIGGSYDFVDGVGVFSDKLITKSQRIAELQPAYQEALKNNALSIASAIAEDGVSEDDNIASLRSARTVIKTKYQSDIIAIIMGA